MALLNITNQDGVHVVHGIYPDDAEVASYIVQAAKARGIDPQTALQVWSHEGRGNWQSTVINSNGQREPSYGPFQLYKGGGLGNQMQEETGLDPADPKNWKQGVDYALDYAARNGWNSWYGAKAAGITGKMGINGAPNASAPPPATAAAQPASPKPKGLSMSFGTNNVQDKNAQTSDKGNQASVNFGQAFKKTSKPFQFSALPQTPSTNLTPDQLGLINRLNLNG